MKINTLSSSLKACIICFLTSLLIIISCKKNAPESGGLSKDNLKTLKEWQSKNFSKNSILFEGMTPNWSSLYENKLKDKIVYEIDLTNTDNAYITNGIISKGDKDTYQPRSRFKLLMFKDGKTGKITDGYYMVSLSDKPTHYVQQDKFTGYIYFYNKKGNFVNGWSFDNGKTVQGISQSTKAEYIQSVNSKLTKKLKMSDFGKGRIQVAAQEFCYTSTIPIYSTICVFVNDSPPVCTTQIIGYNYGRFCVQVEIPLDGNGGVLPETDNPDGLVPLGGPELPTVGEDGPAPKNYGIDPNCLNCQIPLTDFDKLLADAEAAGLVVYVPVPNVTVTLPDGSTAIGTITEIRTTSGALVVAYFKPNVTSGPFTLGYQYSLGNKGPNGAENANTPSPVFFSPAGLPINFGTLPSFGGGGSGGGVPTYKSEINLDENLDVSDLGIPGLGQALNFSIYYDNTNGDFKPIAKNDPEYNNRINEGLSNLPINFAPCTTYALRQMGRDKGWDIGVSTLEFNRRVGQAFQEAVFKLYKQKLLGPQLLRVKYQPQDNISIWRQRKVGNSGQVIPDWTYDVNFMGVSFPLSQHWFYDAKAVTGTLYLSSSKFQIGGYLDVLSKKKVPNTPPPALVFVTTTNTIISPSILAAAISVGVQIRQSFVLIINGKLYLTQSFELTSINDKFINIPTNLLKILSGPVDFQYPTQPNNGPDFEEVR